MDSEGGGRGNGRRWGGVDQDQGCGGRLDQRRSIAYRTTGACDAFMKLAPVLTELVKRIPGKAVVQRTGISVERIAIALPRGNQALLAAVNAAQSALESDGTLPRLRRKWLGDARLDQSRPAT